MDHRLRRRGIALAVGLLVVATAPDSGSQETESSFQDALASCIEVEQQLSVLFLMDESGSLDDSDPEAQRVVASLAALGAFGPLADARSLAGSVSIEVAVAGFGSTFTPGEFRPLDVTNLPLIEADLRSFEERTDAQSTDYVGALRGAIGMMEQRGGCKLVIWFTDGEFVFSDAIEEREEFESRITEPTGDRANDYEAAGRRWLCDDDDAIADQLREEQIFLITAALTLDAPQEARFTQRITEGIDGAGVTCGDRWREGATYGSFENAEDADDLIFQIVSQLLDPNTPVTVGNHPFTLSFGMTQAFIVVSTPTEGYTASLTTPQGDVRSLSYGEDAFSLGGVVVVPDWLTQRTYVLTLDMNPDDRSWEGRWLLSFTPDDNARSKILFFGDLSVELLESAPSGVVGVDLPLTFSVKDAGGGSPVGAAREALSPSAEIDGRNITGNWLDDGFFEVVVPARTSTGSVEIIPVVSIVVRDATADLERRLDFKGDPVVVDFAAPPPTTTTTTTTLPPPPRLPSIEDPAFTLPELVAPGSVARAGAVSIIAPDGGCVELERAGWLVWPGSGQVPRIEVEGSASALVSCADVIASADPGSIDPGGRALIDVAVTAGDEGRGEAVGFLDFRLVTADDGQSESVRVTFEVQVRRPRPPAAVWALFALLAIGGVGLPLLAARWLGSPRATALHPTPNRLEVASKPMSVAFSYSREADDGGVVFRRMGDQIWDEPDEHAQPYVVGGGSDPTPEIEIPTDRSGVTVPIVIRLRADGLGATLSIRDQASSLRLAVPDESGSVPAELSGVIALIGTAGVDELNQVCQVQGRIVLFGDTEASDATIGWDRVADATVLRLAESIATDHELPMPSERTDTQGELPEDPWSSATPGGTEDVRPAPWWRRVFGRSRALDPGDDAGAEPDDLEQPPW